MECNRIRAGSASTAGGGRERALSVFSEGYQTTTTAPTSPATSLRDYSSAEDDEIFEIDKETFEANVKHARKDSCQSQKLIATNMEPKIINGSTLSGIDPLHSHIGNFAREPRWWIEERQREERKASGPPTTKRKRSAAVDNSHYLDPDWYDTLPYSPQGLFTSGLDMDADPETTAEQFWNKVQGAWETSIKYESLEDRRAAFEEEFFKPSMPEKREEFRQEWFRDELTVGETW